MYQVIARKYRPQKFAELLNQEHVRTTLENAITQSRIAHGYIFSGQRGTGKTTVARILARCLNCVLGPCTTPCGKCESCLEIAAGGALDVIEIDAASNRGINEMRELRESVRYRPARDRYKVFIIDEAHQITSEAFNALLKTLEEPPGGVVFVLCTTEAHKIPATIASRCQHFSFRSVGFEEVVGRLEWICGQEGIQADAETLAVLAQVGEGSVRDSLSALDQAIAHCGAQLKAAEVRALLGVFSLEALDRVTRALAETRAAGMLELVDELVRNGHHLQHFCRELARYFRNLLVAKIAGQDTRAIAASRQERERLAAIAGGFSEQDLTRYLQLTLDLFRDLQYSLQPRLHMELGLIRLVEAGRLMPIEQALASLAAAPEPAPPPLAPPPGRPTAAPTLFSAVEPAQASGVWKEKLRAAFAQLGMQSSADAIEHSEVLESDGTLEVRTPKDFALAMRPAEVEKALKHLGGDRRKLRITFVEAEGAARPAPAAERSADELTRRALEHPEVQRFREVFPGAEVRGVRDLKE